MKELRAPVGLSRERFEDAYELLGDNPPLGLAVQRHGDELRLVTAPEVCSSVEPHLNHSRPEALSKCAARGACHRGLPPADRPFGHRAHPRLGGRQRHRHPARESWPISCRCPSPKCEGSQRHLVAGSLRMLAARLERHSRRPGERNPDYGARRSSTSDTVRSISCSGSDSNNDPRSRPRCQSRAMATS